MDSDQSLGSDLDSDSDFDDSSSDEGLMSVIETSAPKKKKKQKQQTIHKKDDSPKYKGSKKNPVKKKELLKTDIEKHNIKEAPNGITQNTSAIVCSSFDKIEDQKYCIIKDVFPDRLFENDFFRNNFSIISFMNDKLTRKIDRSIQLEKNNKNFVDRKEEFAKIKHNVQKFENLFKLSEKKLEKLMEFNLKEFNKLKKKSEVEFGEDLITSKNKLEKLADGLREMETFLTEVGSPIVQVGNTIQHLDKQKQRAHKIKKLLAFFDEMNSYNLKEFQKQITQETFKYRVFYEQKRELQIVKIIQEMNTIIITELRASNKCSKGIKNFEWFKTHLESNMLKRFAKVYKDSGEPLDIKKRRAQTLIDYGVFEKCASIIVTRVFYNLLEIPDSVYLFSPDEDFETIEHYALDASDAYEDDTNDISLSDSLSSISKGFGITASAEGKKRREKKINKKKNKLDTFFVEKNMKFVEKYSKPENFEELLKAIEDTATDTMPYLEKLFSNEQKEIVLEKIFTRLILFVKQIVSKIFENITEMNCNSFLTNFSRIYGDCKKFQSRIANNKDFQNVKIEPLFSMIFGSLKGHYMGMELNNLNEVGTDALSAKKKKNFNNFIQ